MRTKLLAAMLLMPMLLLIGCSGDDNPTNDDDNQTSDEPVVFEFSSSTLTATVGAYTSLALQVDNLPEGVFAVSFRITRSDAGVVTYVLDETAIGPCFGDEAILFYEMDDDVFCGAVSRVAGDDTWVTEGTVAALRLNMQETGTCTLTPNADDFALYDEAGEELAIGEIELGHVTISVIESE